MKILIGCEYSGRVRDAFARRGHTAVSCDLRPSESPHGWHIQADLLTVIGGGGSWESWDMMIAHPYCTYNNLAGIRWMYHPADTLLPRDERRRHPRYPNRMHDFLKGVEFFNALKNCDIPKIVLENSMPHGLAMEHIGSYDQKVQPWHFGSPFTKAAALWLKGVPKLQLTHDRAYYVERGIEIVPACHLMAPGPNREKERSRTDPAIAEAFAEQWGGDAIQAPREAA
jgi:hypothetical protein